MNISEFDSCIETSHGCDDRSHRDDGKKYTIVNKLTGGLFGYNGKSYFELCSVAANNWIVNFPSWELILVKENQIKSVPVVSGYFCSGGCKNYFPQSEANQSDGSFRCFNCRKYPFYR